jgi:hypothetical protein
MPDAHKLKSAIGEMIDKRALRVQYIFLRIKALSSHETVC